MLLAGVLGGAGALTGCGPTGPEGREGFTSNADEVGDDTLGSETAETDTETDTGGECEELVNTGGVSINSIEKLELLSGVTKIDGDVEITGDMDELFGLECLTEITGFLYVHDLTALTTFEGLEALQQVGGYLFVGGNDQLLTFTGLDGLRELGSYLHVTQNPSLQNLDGLDGLSEIGDFLIVDNNPSLTNIDGLSQVPGSPQALRIESNASLTDLDGLSGIKGVSDELAIIGNDSLSDTSGLAGIQAIGGLYVQANPSMTSLDLVSLQTVDGPFVITAMPGLSDLDGFGSLFGINGTTILVSTGIVQTDGLSGVTQWGSTVRIEENPNLISLEGLVGMSEVSYLTIDQNSNLAFVNLASLQVVYEVFSVWGAENLEFLFMPNLDAVGGFFRLGYTGLSFIEFTPLGSVADDLLIWNNPQLAELSGLGALESIGGRLYLRQNAGLTSLSGLENLSTVADRVLIIDNDSLQNLDGLSGLSSAGAVTVNGNFNLNNVAGLSGLSSLPGWLRIQENEALSNLTGLNNLTQVGQELRIADNFNLAAIPGLTSLQGVGGQVNITGNVDLPTCTAQALVNQLVFAGGVDISGNLPDACGN